MSQTIIITVTSEAPPEVTANRIHKMLRGRFEHVTVVTAVAGEQGPAPSIGEALMEPLDIIDESVKVFADNISQEYPRIRDLFGEHIVGVLQSTKMLKALTKQRDKLLQTVLEIEQRPDGGKGLPHTRTVMMSGSTVKMLHDMTKEEMQQMPAYLLHDMFHIVADSKHIDASCSMDKDTIVNWLYDNVRLSKKEMH